MSRPSRRRTYWAWQTHLDEGRLLYLWANPKHAGIVGALHGGAVRVRITVLTPRRRFKQIGKTKLAQVNTGLHAFRNEGVAK